MPRVFFLPALLLLLYSATAFAQTAADLDNQVRELRRKIASVKDEIDKTEQKTQQDARNFTQYSSDHDRLVQQQQERIDSLKADLSGAQQGADSLSTSLHSLRASQKEFDLLGSGVRLTLERYCDSLLSLLAPLPQPIAVERTGALTFLKAEIASRAIDNHEALDRLWQIIDAVKGDGSSIDIFAGRSADASVSGQVSFIRIGLVWIAMVNEKGSSGAIWQPDSGGGSWKRIEDPAQSAELARAVAVRSGTAVPQLIMLPANPALTIEQQQGADQ